MFVPEKEIEEIKTMRRLKIMENLFGEKKALTSSTKIANEIYPTVLGNPFHSTSNSGRVDFIPMSQYMVS